MKTLTKEQALHCAKIFKDYFGNFSRIDEYMRDQKIASIQNIPVGLPGMGFEDELFSDFTMSPKDMKLEVIEIDNETWDNCIIITSSHSNMVNIPGKVLKLAVKETNSNKLVGFIRLGSPVINMKPRNVMLGNVPNLNHFNKTAIMGFVIVPSQPFGYNYLGGKLLAAICCSHYVRELMNKKYNMNLCLFETTSLYGNSKSSSQYDGMKPYIRYKGLTDSDFIPMLHGKPYEELKSYVENIVGSLIKKDASSIKLKTTTAIIGLIKRSLKDDKTELEDFNKVINNAKDLTEQKRYYISHYGIKNFIDIVNGKTNTIIKDDTYDKFELNNIIEWWRNKAIARYETLKKENKIRNEIEIWTKNKDLQIIR
jgi:hypothetical protein